MNLLEISWIRSALRSRLYPAVFQWITVALFVVLLLAVLFGPNNAGQNFGMALTWHVWWPLLPLSFLFLGRFWCAICPFAWLTDHIQKAVGVRLPVPAVLRRHGLGIIAGGFIVVTYLDEAWRFDSDARKTGYLLLFILAAVIFCGAFFERRTFCRHLCFIGAFAANYSRAGMLELRADPDRCRDCTNLDCYRGSDRAAGCPLFLFAPDAHDSGTCQLCANCVKNCPHDAIRISVRRPGAGLWRIREAQLMDAVLAAIVAGVVLIEQIAMLGGWNRVVAATADVLRVDPYVWFPVVYTALLAVFIAAPLLGLALASVASQVLIGAVSLSGLKQNYSLFGYAVIPVALAGHLAYSFERLLTSSRALPFAFAALLNWFPANTPSAWPPRPAILWMQISVLALGGALSLYVAFRLAQRHARQANCAPWRAYLPPCVLLLVLLAANVLAVIAAGPQF
jgi:ferredoxin